MTTAPRPIGLTDEQLDIIRNAAAPLDQRSEFLAAVFAQLSGCDTIGDGLVSRVCRELAPQFFAPPDLSHSYSKYR
jgi:hypothetical protein